MSSSPAEAPLLARLFARWNQSLPTMGVLALAALLLAVATGVALAAGYDVGRAAESVALLGLASRAGRLLRGLHAWSSHLAIALTLLHTVEHLASGGDRRQRTALWLRIVASLPLLVGAALTGFMLKGDAEGDLARQILGGLLERLPLVGAPLTAALLGAGDDLQTIYVHHIATLTLLVLAIAVEHGRRLWPSAGSALGVAALALLCAWVLPPALHDGVDPVVKGPWYLLGLQEALHWLVQPAWAWPLALAPLLLLGLLPRFRDLSRRRALALLGAMLVAAGAASLFVASFRGAGWALTAPWTSSGPSSRAATPLLSSMSFAALDSAAVPEILGRREGCLACHSEVTGLGVSHDPKVIGCFSCHLGDPLAPDAARAHLGLVRVPGNLDTAGLTCGRCHEAVLARVQRAPMATARGIVSVDRWAFGEQPTPDGPHPRDSLQSLDSLDSLGHSPADTHLSQLCAGCHLGVIKGAPGPASERSRGGGCAACHVSYPEQRDYTKDKPSRFAHPAVSVAVRDESCFGCHSRSGRISLSYAGWWESGLSRDEAARLAPGSVRVLEDGRVLRKASEDVHREKGLACIDCHTAQETMGDGKPHQHEEEATHVRCETCHRTQPARSVARADLAPEAAAIVRLRDGPEEPALPAAGDRRAGGRSAEQPTAPPSRPRPARFLLEDQSGEALTNATPLPDGTVELRGKLGGARTIAKPPVQACSGPEHARLSCSACHTAWVAQCVGCHTQWDAQGRRRDALTGREQRGAWVEYDVAPRVGPPALGVVLRDGRESIVPFLPGMVLTLNGRGQPAPEPLPASAAALLGPGTRALRAFAPAAPHTTTRAGLSCKDCHLDPQVLGYGRGTLSLVEEGGSTRWRFEPAYARSPTDGLPGDAWIGFLDGKPGTATRTNARSLSLAEQRRVLDVGACLGCHDPTSARGKALFANFRESRARLGSACRAPPAP